MSVNASNTQVFPFEPEVSFPANFSKSPFNSRPYIASPDYILPIFLIRYSPFLIILTRKELASCSEGQSISFICLIVSL